MFNDQIFFFFYNLAHQSTFLDWLITFFAQTFPNIVIILAAMFLLYHHEILPFKKSSDEIWGSFRILGQRWKEIVLVFFSGIFAWILAYVLKIIIQIPRPFVQFQNVQALLSETDFSFPSGHSTFFMALGMAIFFYHKNAGYLFMFFALLIGIARVAAGVHFPIDILGGFVLGIVIAYFVRFFYDKLHKKV